MLMVTCKTIIQMMFSTSRVREDIRLEMTLAFRAIKRNEAPV